MPLSRTRSATEDALALRREQSDVGISCARRSGGAFTAASVLHLIVLPPSVLVELLPSILLLAISAAIQLSSRRTGRSGALALLAGFVLDLVALAAFLVPGTDDSNRALLGCITMLTSMALPAGMLAIGSAPMLRWIAPLASLPVLVLGAATTWESGRAGFVALSVVVCWSVAFVGARWLAGSVERARVGTARLRTAHIAERRSSESEAQRRYDARLLHDTILATLTLIAHRGEGVPAATLTAQAESDLSLLRRLDRSVPTRGLDPRAEAACRVPEALAQVGRRSEALGVRVLWHARAEIALAPSASDALARATGECLENVRRHSGVAAAHITVDDDAESVRVAVSDAGRGFDPDAVPEHRLGLAQSVIGRIEAVGGTVRVFSAEGAGTTVLMTVPR